MSQKCQPILNTLKSSATSYGVSWQTKNCNEHLHQWPLMNDRAIRQIRQLSSGFSVLPVQKEKKLNSS